jgi:hypothetical protein
VRRTLATEQGKALYQQRQHIIASIFGSTKHNRVAGSPVTNGEMFFGREDVFAFINGKLSGRHRDNVVVLYGQRRTGKTSVLYQLEQHLESPHACVFIDLHRLALGGLRDRSADPCHRPQATSESTSRARTRRSSWRSPGDRGDGARRRAVRSQPRGRPASPASHTARR